MLWRKAVARWLSPDDLFAIKRLQTRGIQLDFERAVLWPHSALQAALYAHIPISAIGAETIVLYPSATHRASAVGFLQLRSRRGRPEADIVYLAPALDSEEDAVAIWYRLLAEAAQEIGARGVQRLFAQVTSGNSIEQVFAQAGFGAYAREEIYCLPKLPADVAHPSRLRRQTTRDGWNLLRLYTELTPRPVQIAEGMLSPEGQAGKMGDWWDQSREAGFILEVEGEFAGTVRIRRGSAAYWLRFGLHPQAQAHSDRLLQGALALLHTTPQRPIYCAVRDYESGMALALERAGFQHIQTRSLLVKHLTVRAKEPLLKLVPALEKHAKPAASVSPHISPLDVIGNTPSHAKPPRMQNFRRNLCVLAREDGYFQ